MARNKKNVEKIIPTFAVVVDGKTEAFYLQMLKRNERDIRVKIKPEIPNKKTLEAQFKQVCDLSKDYTKVFWIVDLDTILKEDKETQKGNERPSEVLMNKILKKR